MTRKNLLTFRTISRVLLILLFAIGVNVMARQGDPKTKTAAVPGAAAVPAPADSKEVLPPIGKQLSVNPGLSLIRIGNGPGEQVVDKGETRTRQLEFSSINEAARLTASGHALLEVLTQASGLGPPRVFEYARLPKGEYKVNVATETGGRKALFRILADGYEHAFGARIRFEERDIDVLVLQAKGKETQHGFKPTTVPDTKFSWWHQGPPGEHRLHWIRFQSDMESLATQLEKTLGKVVVNETRIDGRFEGRIEYREGALLADLERALLKRGLLLQPARRKAEAVFIEPMNE